MIEARGAARFAAETTKTVLKNLAHLEIDALIPIGGDDTLSYAERLHREGVCLVAIPKTMDNDVFGTDYCIGFSTAVTRSVQYIHQLRTNASSHERIAMVELFGRNSGETSLISAYLAGVDRAIISEVPFDPQRLAALVMDNKRANPSNYAMVTISEGARMIGDNTFASGEADAYGHRNTHIPLSEVSGGVKRVDVDELYDSEQYRPKVRHVLGKPMFLY